MATKKQSDEPIKTAITSHSDHDGITTYILYKDGGLKIIQQQERGDVVIYIPFEDMAEIIKKRK